MTPTKLEPGQPFTVAMLMFPIVSALNLTGPLEVFGRMRDLALGKRVNPGVSCCRDL